MEIFDEDESGTVELEEFRHTIENFNKNLNSKESWMCSKSRMMTAISDEYEDKLKKDEVKLKQLFNEADINKDGYLQFSELRELCKGVEKDISEDKIKEIWNVAVQKSLTEDKNYVTADAFAIAAF